MDVEASIELKGHGVTAITGSYSALTTSSSYTASAIASTSAFRGSCDNSEGQTLPPANPKGLTTVRISRTIREDEPFQPLPSPEPALSPLAVGRVWKG